MDGAWITAGIAAVSALAGSALTGFITYKVADRDREDRARGELGAALAAFGHSVDRMSSEIGQLPPTPRGLDKQVIRTIGKARKIDWILGQITRHTVGRPALRALDGLMAASNRLVLVAPKDLVDVIGRIHQLLGRLEDRDERWHADWANARSDLLRISREIVGAT